MFFGENTTPQQKAGMIVCLPKKGPMLTPADIGPITILNSDFKIITRLLAQTPIVEEHL
jgi:hypothetical protein